MAAVVVVPAAEPNTWEGLRGMGLVLREGEVLLRDGAYGGSNCTYGPLLAAPDAPMAPLDSAPLLSILEAKAAAALPALVVVGRRAGGWC